MSGYRYAPLNQSTSEIRLMVLHPGTFSDPLTCSLRTVSLDAYPEYYALSYVWGASKKTASITVDGVELGISKNLEIFLRHIRWEHGDFTVWADAVCIDQTDRLDKGYQVPLMGRIYSQTVTCLAWLGEKSKHTEKAVRIIKDLMEGAHLYETEAYEILNDTETVNRLVEYVQTQPSETVSNTNSNSPPSEWAQQLLTDWTWFGGDSFARITPDIGALSAEWCQNPYWTRVWTLQEVCLPVNVDLIWSDLAIPFSSLFTTPGVGPCHASCCIAPFEVAVNRPNTKYNNNYVTPILRMLDIADVVLKLRLQVAEDNLQPDSLRHKQSPLALAAVIGNRNCDNPRDYIYGISGLVEAIWGPVDYSASVNEVYTEAARGIIMWTGQLDVLYFACGRRARQNLPSWVPDWSMKRSYRDRFVVGESPYNACGSTRIQRGAMFPSSRTLRVIGYKLGTVTEICSGPLAGRSPTDKRMREWEDFIASSTPTSTADLDTLARTLLLDLSPQLGLWWQRMSDTDVSHFASYRSSLRTGIWPQDPSNATYRIYKVLRRFHVNRLLLRTDTGHVGVSSDTSVTVGDEVWIFHGAHAPYLVRERGNPRENLWVSLVCQAYLHGFMDGEVIEWANRQGKKPEVCVIG